ncbi:MAG: hypothetical protein R2838_04420 [Caldilineaceae bacterium]
MDRRALDTCCSFLPRWSRAALLLTFSKGALFIAVPVMLAVLWLGGLGLLRRQGRTTRPLWALAGLAALLLLALLPFLGTAGAFNASSI